MDCYYRWYNPFNNTWYETKCEVLEMGEKTAKIKLKGWVRNDKRPDTIMRVHIKSLTRLPKETEQPDLSWQKWSYFD